MNARQYSEKCSVIVFFLSFEAQFPQQKRESKIFISKITHFGNECVNYRNYCNILIGLNNNICNVPAELWNFYGQCFFFVKLRWELTIFFPAVSYKVRSGHRTFSDPTICFAESSSLVKSSRLQLLFVRSRQDLILLCQIPSKSHARPVFLLGNPAKKHTEIYKSRTTSKCWPGLSIDLGKRGKILVSEGGWGAQIRTSNDE